MGNLITDKMKNSHFKLSTISTDLFMKSLLISISQLAKSKWEKDLGVFIAERNQNILGGGLVGFDLSELGFSAQSIYSQKEFINSAIANSIEYQNWNAFNYVTDNTGVMLDYFREFKKLVDQYNLASTKKSDSRIKFIFHTGIETVDYCKLHQVLLIDNVDLNNHKCFVCDNLILSTKQKFTFIEIDIYNSPVTKWYINTKSTVDKIKAIQVIDKLSDKVRGTDNEFRMLGNKWKEMDINTAKKWIMDGLKYDLAYTSSENLKGSEIVETVRQDLDFIGDRELSYAYSSSSDNPWKSKSYSGWSLTDWTLVQQDVI